MTITVYTKPACVQCNMTKKYLDKEGLEYDLVDITEDAAALERILGLGFASAPVVESGDLMFAGFNPNKLALLTA